MHTIITRNLSYLILFSFLLFTGNQTFAQGKRDTVCTTIVVNYPAANNAMVFSKYATTNYSGTGAPDFMGCAWTFLGTPGTERTYMQIDLTSIPPGATILNAILNLYADSSAGDQGQSGSNTALISRITSYWDPTTITWNTQPTISSVDQVSLPESDYNYESYPDNDVTNLINDIWTNQSNSYGIEIQLVTEVAYTRMRFCASTNPDSTSRPQLYICYSDTASGINSTDLVEQDLNLFPNPCTNDLKLSLTTNSATQFNIAIVDVLGRTLGALQTSNLPAGNEVIDLSKEIKDLPQGMYFITLTSGNTILEKTFIKN